ncbi:kinase-like domain-containing protein, partial [Hyaloraphidium curvatum]
MHTFSELCEGDLQRYIAAHAPLGERTVARVLTLVLRAVATLHAHGIVHRDLKAPNIFLRDMGDPLSLAVGDLISSAVNPPGTVLGPADGLPDDATSLFSLEAALRTSCGTPLCLSPEVALGRPYGPKVDLWAAGILLYQLFCLRTPFEDSRSYLELYRRIPLADYSVPPGMIPPGAADLLSRLLDPDPGRRPSAAEAMRHPWLVAAAGHFEAPPRKARMGSVSSTDLSTTSAPSVGEPMVGRDAERAAAMMLSGAEVDFDFATGTLRVAGDGTI